VPSPSLARFVDYSALPELDARTDTALSTRVLRVRMLDRWLRDQSRS
jgi:hypothetical protein